jgi:hypothetical protein
VNYSPGTLSYTPSISNFIVVKHQDADGEEYMADISVRVNNRCGSSPWSDTKQFTMPATGKATPQVRTNPGLQHQLVARENEVDLNVYPDHEASEIRLSWDVEKLMRDGFEMINISNLEGKSVKKIRLKRMKSNVISVEEMDNGQYIFKIVGDNTSYSQKIMVRD